jgi:hypothetical protein
MYQYRISEIPQYIKNHLQYSIMLKTILSKGEICRKTLKMSGQSQLRQKYQKPSLMI